MAGYHLKDIKKGVLGEFSKIEEEFLEWEDAKEQRCRIMQFVELSDLVGAVKHYCLKHGYDFDKALKLANNNSCEDPVSLWDMIQLIKKSPSETSISYLLIRIDEELWDYDLDLSDLIKMNDITARAFESGHRK